MLRVIDLTKTFSHITLFENISFMLGNREKVGLLGTNGTGKSTLFKILMGLEEYDGGNIELINEKLGYLPQEFEFQKGQLVGEFLESLVENPYSEMYLVEAILGRLQLKDVDEYDKVENLSHGQQMKLKLAELILQDATILLLDEPTNHLDIYGLIWLEGFIKSLSQICIIISHDRAFLNNVVNKTFELDEYKLNIFDGNYDDYIIGKEGLLTQRSKEFGHQERKREQLEKLLASAKKIADGKARSRAVSSAKKRMEREVLRNEIYEYKEEKVKDLKIKGSIYDKKLALRTKELTFSYDDSVLLKDISFDIRGSEKVWLSGSNGVGKTTLVKLLTNKQPANSGEVFWGENVNWAYFSQDQGHLDMNETVQNYFLDTTGVSYGRSFALLEKFLFSRDMKDTKLGVLSPGQRARLSFAIFAQNEYDFLILDEPTNHLDIKTKEVVEKAVKEFKGGILLISHDRYFVENVGITRNFIMKERGSFNSEHL